MDAQAKVLTVWIAYAIGILVTGTPFAGVIMAYFCRGTNTEPGVAGHNRAQIRSFWWGFLGWMVAIVLFVLGFIAMEGQGAAPANEAIVGAILLLLAVLLVIVVQIWFTIYAIIGIVRVSNRKNWPGADPMMNSAAVFG